MPVTATLTESDIIAGGLSGPPIPVHPARCRHPHMPRSVHDVEAADLANDRMLRGESTYVLVRAPARRGRMVP